MEQFRGLEGLLEGGKPRGRPPGAASGHPPEKPTWTPVLDRPIHDAIVDQLILSPGIGLTELSRMFGYSPQAIGLMMRSDFLREKLRKKREDLVDPILKATLEDRFQVMLEVSLRVATDVIGETKNAELALKGIDVAARALGFGAKTAPPSNQIFVVNPGVAPSSAEWAKTYAPVATNVVDITPKE